MPWDLVVLEKDSDLNELLTYSKKIENNKLVVAKTFTSRQEILELRKKLDSKNHLICFLVKEPDNRNIKRFRSLVDLVAVLGGNISLNKFALTNKFVDFLLQPSLAGRLAFDASNARIAGEKKKPVAFLFNSFLNLKGMKRVSLFRNNFFTVKLMKKFKVNALVFSGARNASEVRSVKDLKSFLVLLGFTEQQSERFIGRFAENFFENK
jgi:RNase P/RNase MRP subunit p30